ncbi:MAG: anti-sigma factor [Actinomycetota bacterium]
MEKTHEEFKALIAPYLLGAVPSDEVPLIRAHILSCEECLSEADGYSTVTTSLALAADPVPLPSGFADRVLSRVADIQPAPTLSATRRPRWRWGWAQAMAVVSLVATAVMAVALININDDLSSNRAALSALVRSDEGFELGGQGAVGHVVPTTDGSLFLVAGLPDTPEGQVYQLWFTQGACGAGESGPCDVTSAGTFEVSDGVTILEIDRSIKGFDDAAVSIEPKGGSVAPTSDPVISSG